MDNQKIAKELVKIAKSLVAKTFPKGQKVTVLDGKHKGKVGIVDHSDSSITTVKLEGEKFIEPVWTKMLKEVDDNAKLAKSLVAKTGSIVLRADDFANKDMWYALLEAVGEETPHKGNNWNEVEELHLRVTKLDL